MNYNKIWGGKPFVIGIIMAAVLPFVAAGVYAATADDDKGQEKPKGFKALLTNLEKAKNVWTHKGPKSTEDKTEIVIHAKEACDDLTEIRDENKKVLPGLLIEKDGKRYILITLPLARSFCACAKAPEKDDVLSDALGDQNYMALEFGRKWKDKVETLEVIATKAALGGLLLHGDEDCGVLAKKKQSTKLLMLKEKDYEGCVVTEDGSRFLGKKHEKCKCLVVEE